MRHHAVDVNRGLFLSLTGVLLGFGLIMVHSASITSWPNTFEQVNLSRHAMFLVLATGCGCFCAALPRRFWWSVAPYLFLVTLVLLVAVLVPGVGLKANGARRWLRLGGLTVQPSEMAKLALPLLMGRILIGNQQSPRPLMFRTAFLLAPSLLIVPLIFLEPDLGTSVFLVTITAIFLWLSGWRLRNYLIALLLIAPCAGMFLSVKAYQLERVKGFVATWHDMNQAPYQVRQSLLSLGAGGFSGLGIGKGWQKLSFLPEAHTDFVFAVVGEELGLRGTLCLVLVWCGLFISGYTMIRRHERSSFEYIVSLTLLSEVILQAAVNTAVATALLPAKGISHPFLSYGGSNLFVSLTLFGVIYSLTSEKQRPEPPG